MFQSSKTSSESSLKKDSIVVHLRNQIVEGELPPGSQLPTHVELENRYQVSRDTVQRVLDRLVEEEFVYTNRRRGTYVSINPPHLSRYALVFHDQPNIETQSRFEIALCHETMRLYQGGQRRVFIYRDVGGHVNSPDYQKLVREVETNRLAGIIFTFDPEVLHNSSVMTQPHIARVALALEQRSVPTVNVDMASFMDKALDYFLARGRKRVAVISHLPSTVKDNQYLLAGVAARGMTLHRYWLQTTSLSTAQAADESAHLLMHSNQLERPNALIIDDDNLVEHAVRGLMTAGVRVPDEVEVVAHCNFPHCIDTPIPLKWWGFDVRQILSECLASMASQRQDKHVPSLLKVEALFEEDVEADCSEST